MAANNAGGVGRAGSTSNLTDGTETFGEDGKTFEQVANDLLKKQEASALRAIAFTLKSSMLKTATDSWMTAARNA